MKSLLDFKINQKRKNIYKTLDLFAGIGGLRLGFELTKSFKTIYANDIEEKCKYTYDLNFRSSPLKIKDINNIKSYELPNFDFLLAGFPCQAFSIAGYREGFEDKKGRGKLFFEILRILRDKKPNGFLLENVKNLLTHNNGITYKIIKNSLKKETYFIKEAILNTKDYGIPQNRERVYIIGFKDKEKIKKFEFPKVKPLKYKVKDFLDSEVEEKYYYNNKPLFNKIKDYIIDKNSIYQWRRKYIRESKSKLCPTLTANMGTGGHNVPIIKDNYGVRKLSPIECLRLQGFPKNYKLPNNLADSVLYKQIGNSVSIPTIKAIAKEIIKVLD